MTLNDIIDINLLDRFLTNLKNLFLNKDGTANKAASIPFGTVDSTSTETAFTATVDGITELRDGVSLYLKNTVVTSAAASTAPKCWTLNINNLGAKPVYVTTAAATYSTTHFTKNYKMLFTYDTSLNSGNGGWYIGQLFNSNTTYSDMTQAEIDAGTGTTGRKITPKTLRDNFYTEDEVDTLLGSKANSSDLATVATSGSYNDLDDTPTIPAAPGTLNTNNTTVQTVSSSESLSGTIKLHKIAKTGDFTDLNYLPLAYEPETTTVPNVTSVGSASTWSFVMGTGNDEHTLIISGGNGSTPALGTVKTVATGKLTDGVISEMFPLYTTGLINGGGSSD